MADVIPIPYCEIATMEHTTMRHLDRSVILPVACLFGGILKEVARTKSQRAFWKLYAFPKLVLFRLKRGGKNQISSEMNRRCKLFNQECFLELFTEAKQAADDAAKKRKSGDSAEPSKPPAPVDPEASVRTVIDEVISEHFPGMSGGLEHDDGLDVPFQALRRAGALAKNGAISRGLAALSKTKLAPTNDESIAKMRDLHPQADEPPQLPANPPPVDCSVKVDAKQVKQILRSFPPQSSAGSSGLAPAVALQLCNQPGVDVAMHLAVVINMMLRNDLPGGETRQYLFGARLIALVKKNGGLRPIACGDVLRRIAGKAIVRACITKIAPMLHRQLGVGISCGADIMVALGLAFARLARDKGADPQLAMLSMDLKNAFNMISRTIMLAQVAKMLPEAYHYAVAAYGMPTYLTYGFVIIISSSGAQQGDPPGCIFFAVTIQFVLDMPAVGRALIKCHVGVLYLDDSILAGRAVDVASAAAVLRAHLPLVGLMCNDAKSCWYVADLDVPAPYDSVTKEALPFARKNFSELVVLGCPAVDPDVFLQREFVKWARQLSVVASLHERHVALAMFHAAASGSRVMHLLRNIGPTPQSAWLTADKIVRENLAQLLGFPLCGAAGDQAISPVRHGGLGFTPLHTHASTAHVVCLIRVRNALVEHRMLFSESFAPSIDAYISARANAATSSTTLATYPNEQASLVSLVRSDVAQKLPKSAQRDVSHAIEKVRFAALCAKVSAPGVSAAAASVAATAAAGAAVASKKSKAVVATAAAAADSAASDAATAKADSARDVARLRAVSAKYTGLWLYTSASSHAYRLWLPNNLFGQSVRLRLGLPLGQVERCSLCHGKSACDQLGDHSLSCLSQGVKTLTHSAVLDELMKFASVAGCVPAREPHPFAAQPNLRLDAALTIPLLRDELVLVDVAITHALATYNIRHSGPAAAATAYERFKHAKYDAAVAAEADHRERAVKLVPLVMDTYGGVGQAAASLLPVIAKLWAERADVPAQIAVRMLMHKMSFTVIKCTAQTVCKNMRV